MDAKINQIIIDTLKPYDPKEIGVFGSYARGELGPGSDIDIAYIIDRGFTLFDLSGLKIELEEKLNRKVDLVSKNHINKHVEPYIKKDMCIIYEKGQ